MYHYKTRFRLVDPNKARRQRREQISSAQAFYYDHPPYSQTNDKFNITHDHYEKIKNWPAPDQITQKENDLVDQLPRIFNEYPVYPLRFIKRTLYDVDKFFKTYFDTPLNILNYSLFLIDLFTNMKHLTKSQKKVYFEINIKRYLNLSYELLSKPILFHEYYKIKKNSLYYRRLWNVIVLAVSVLYDYIINESVQIYNSYGPCCVHDHHVKFCESCDKLTIHYIKYNDIFTTNKCVLVNGQMVDIDEERKKVFSGSECIPIDIYFPNEGETIENIKNNENNGHIVKDKLCYIQISQSSIPWPERKFDTVSRFVSYYQCQDCNIKSRELKFGRDDDFPDQTEPVFRISSIR